MALAVSHAEKTAVFMDETAKKDPTLKALFTECHKAYLAAVADLKSANVKLKLSPDTAHYDERVAGLVGTNSDNASTTLKEMTVLMDKLLDLAAGAADAVDWAEERESYGFGSPDFPRYSCFPVIGLCLWEEEASPVLLRRLLFFREAVVFAFSGLL
ncbi:LOW QUALITY PROTEIN: hypothetical protein BRARA_H01602 [Brassica rapa]|uniref:Pectinesterase inhibitor domain-containing protein n=1 Tax=Brassica campestris TaxID=3711 RepID=A0A397YIR7_BRACM|nr:LOW QUALITY PROTEIN: hypothetical protein BRARA_H01602 [Brassica rapa]